MLSTYESSGIWRSEPLASFFVSSRQSTPITSDAGMTWYSSTDAESAIFVNVSCVSCFACLPVAKAAEVVVTRLLR